MRGAAQSGVSRGRERGVEMVYLYIYIYIYIDVRVLNFFSSKIRWYLGPNDPSHALGCLPDGVKGEKVVLRDLKVFAEVFKPRKEDAGPCVLVRHAHHDHSSAVVAVKVDAFCNFAPSNGEEDCAPAAVAGLAKVVKGQRGLHDVLSGRQRSLYYLWFSPLSFAVYMYIRLLPGFR